MTCVDTAVALWDTAETTAAALDALVSAEQVPLPEAAPPKGPGYYAITLISPTGLYASSRCFPVYIGSARSLAERARRHQTNMGRVVNINSRDLRIAWVQTVGLPMALYAETALIDLLDPVWNHYRFRGFGSRWQGLTRALQAPPPWAVLHPGRRVGRGKSHDSKADLERQVAEHLAATVPPFPLWVR